MNCKCGIITLLFFLFFYSSLQADISVSPEEWNLGPVNNTQILSTEIIITNNGSQPVTVSLVETCDCFYPDSHELELQPDGSQKIVLYFDPSQEQGVVEKMLIIENTTTTQAKILFTLTAHVNKQIREIEESPQPEPGTTQTDTTQSDSQFSETPGQKNLTANLYYSFGCKTCEKLITSFFPEVEQELDITLTIIKKDILQAQVMREYESKLQQLGAVMREFPALLIGSTLLQGEQEIRSGLASAVKQALAESAGPKEKLPGAADKKQDVFPELLFFPVLAAGLADGINPCAFSTLIFLIVSLAYVGKNKKTILLTGIFFTVAVFITYYLIGLGFFYILRVTSFAPLISQIIKILLIGLLFVFAGLSLYDFFLIRKGRSREIILQLPKSIKQRIHKSVRAYVSSLALISGALVLGFLVSVFELACTGQIYFPVIAAIIQTENDITAYLFLALYNLGFITPLLGVFILIYTGVNSEKITTAFQKHMGSVKIILAVVFVLLAVIILVT